MQCITPNDEFDETKANTFPDYCDYNKTDYTNGCNLWSTAINKVHNEISSTNKNLSANLKTDFSQCRETFVDQIQDYNDNNIFEIKSLKKNWFNESTNPISSLSCKRSVYGAFYSNGPKEGQAVDDVNTLWKNIIQDCKNKWNPNDPDLQSKTKVLDSFFLNTDYDAAQSSIQFTYNCVGKNARMYTKCNRPGWESMTSDKNKGWIAKSSCTSNPVYVNDQNPPSCPSKPPSSSITCKDNYEPCAKDDTRPRDPLGPNCCLKCGDWGNEYATYFSYGNAMSNETVPQKTESYHDFLLNACDPTQGNCCVKKSVTNDHQEKSMCTTCSVANQGQNVYDMSNAKIYFFNDSSNTSLYLNYVDNESQKGVAITPTANTSTATPISFSDVRACISGDLENQCNGMRGCNGYNDPGVPGSKYCGVSWQSCITDNACNYGFSYPGDSQIANNPALNCPSVYTLSRAVNNCTNQAYDNENDNQKSLYHMTKMTIPEGAWVTAYYDQNIGTWNENLCDPTNKSVLMMGCGRDQNGCLQAKATSYLGDSNGNLSETHPNCFTYTNNHVNDPSNCKSNSNNDKDDGDEPSCTFSNIHPVVMSRDDEGGSSPQCSADYFQGYTFGFMPGYYKTSYTTQNGPCTDNTTN